MRSRFRFVPVAMAAALSFGCALSAAKPARAQVVFYTNLVYWDFNDADPSSGAGPGFRGALLSPDHGVLMSSAYLTHNFLTRDGNASGAVGLSAFSGSGAGLPGGGEIPPGFALAVQGSNENAPNDGSNTPNNGRFLEFGIDATGYRDIFVGFVTRGSDFGFDSNRIAYSIDGGNTYLDFGLPWDGSQATYFSQGFDFFATPGVTDNADLRFRIVFDGATRPTGNNRIDNLRIYGNPIGGAVAAEPGTAGLLAVSVAVMPVIVLRRRGSRR